MQLTIKIANSINACKTAWDGLLPAKHHLQSKNLAAFEAAQVPDISCCYLQVFVKNKLCGLVYLQQFKFQTKNLQLSWWQKCCFIIFKRFIGAHLPILICGHLFRINFQGYYFEDATNNYLVFDAIEQYTKENKIRTCGKLMKDCTTVFDAPHYNKYNYIFFDGDVTMEAIKQTHWQSFDDYIKQLNKKYRQRAKKIIAAFEGITDSVLDATAISNNKEAIEKLYWNVVDKQNIKLGTVNADYFAELCKSLDSHFEFHALYKGNSMVGFYTYIFYNNEMETHFIGLDYEANKTHKLYFNILFLAIQQMINQKFDKCELGRTAKEAKANAGAQPKQIVNYISVNNALVRHTLNYFLNNFNKSESYSALDRNPFKE